MARVTDRLSPSSELLIRRLLPTALISIALVASAIPFAVAAEGAADEHPLLTQARRNVEQVEAQLLDATQSREAAAAALTIVDARLAEIEQRVNEATDAVRRQELAVEASAVRLEELRAEAEQVEAVMAARAVELFMNGAGTAFEAVLSSGDVQDAIDRSSYLDLVTEGNRTQLEAAVTARRALAAQVERFDAEMARLTSMQAAEQELLDSIESLRDARADALRTAEAEVDDLERLGDDLEGDYDRIETLIEEARSTPVAASPPSASGYGWPLCKTVTSRFGYRWGRQHKGIDIAGNTGDPIGASKAGTVIYAGRQGGYGNLVLVDHNDGIVTAYAHQSEIIAFVGQSVERGERLGSVGNTGNSTGPHLHFETRVNGTAVDPFTYLPSSC